MKGILITSRIHTTIRIVEIKETAKSYMVEGGRFKKGMEVEETMFLSERYGSGSWSARYELYHIDSPYAKSKLDKLNAELNHKDLQYKIQDRLKKSITPEQAKQISEILGL